LIINFILILHITLKFSTHQNSIWFNTFHWAKPNEKTPLALGNVANLVCLAYIKQLCI
jgi:hypothetical protein